MKMKSWLYLLLLTFTTSAVLIQEDSHASEGFVAICKSVKSARFDYARRPVSLSPDEEVLTHDWGEEDYGPNATFSFSFDGKDLTTDIGYEVVVNYVGSGNEVMACQSGEGLVPTGNLYCFAIHPQLNKVVMTRMQIIHHGLANALMGSVHEMDCQFGQLK